MKLHQVRNATIVLELAEQRLLVDPVLGDVASLPAFKMLGRGRRRNPLVPLPSNTAALLEGTTAVLITHAHHSDHLDAAGLAWVRERGLPVWTSSLDVDVLSAKGLDARPVLDGFLGMRVEVLPVSHGRGPIGWMMGPVTGFCFDCPGEPSVLLTSDAVLSDGLLAAVTRLQPGVIVAPAGGANMGIGGDILFSVDELITLAQRIPGQLVFNHLEALDHCPTTRAELRCRLDAEDLCGRTFVPEDGESVDLGVRGDEHPRDEQEFRVGPLAKPGFQKWFVNQIAKVMG